MLPRPQPFYFGPAGAECFAWLHAPNADAAADLGLVICSPFGDEDQAAHRGLRRIAVMAAEAGVATLRFDPPDSGDSAGAGGTHDHPSAWLAALHLAIDTLRAHSGVTRVCLLGARLGVLAAAQAGSTRGDVCALVALAPVIRGRSFLRAALLRGVQVPIGTDTAFELGGHVVSARARAELATIDLLDLPRAPAADVLVVDADSLHASERWRARMDAQGARTESFVAPTLAGLLEASGDAVPSALVRQVADWVAARAAPGARVSTLPRAMSPSASSLQLGAASEAPLVLQAGTTELFAILTEPATGAAHRAVLLLNTGLARRVGPSRLHVEWARRWAGEGIAVMRMDLPGLGDSDVQPGETEGEVYAIDAKKAIAAALAALRARFGPVDCQLVGICSGAYHAYRAALAGAPVQSVVLINQLAYEWSAGMHVSRPALSLRLACLLKERERGITRCSHRAMVLRALHALKWQGLLAAASAWSLVRDAARALRLPLPHDVGAGLQTLAQRGVVIRVVVADGDAAEPMLRLQAGHAVAALQRRGELQLDVIESADHIFTTRAARLRLRAVLDRIVHGQPALSAAVRAGGTPAVLHRPADSIGLLR